MNDITVGRWVCDVRERDEAAESDASWDFEVTARSRSDAAVLGALDRLRLRLMADYEVPVVLEPGGVGCVAVRAELRAGSDGHLRWQVGSQCDDAKMPTHGRGKPRWMPCTAWSGSWRRT